MFKNTSESMQRRELSAAVNSRKNEGGVDPSLWKTQALERDRLAEEVTNLQNKNNKLSAMITDAKCRFTGRTSGRIVPYETVMRWERDRTANTLRIVEVQKKLTKFNIEKKLFSKEQEKTFERTFMQVAKEMLVEEAYNRIVIATVNRCGKNEGRDA